MRVDSSSSAGLSIITAMLASLLLMIAFAAGDADAQTIVLDEYGMHAMHNGKKIPLRAGSLLGQYSTVHEEAAGTPIGLSQAQALHAANTFQSSTSAAPTITNFGAPLWLHLDIDNRSGQTRDYRIFVGEAWADQLDAWVIFPNGQTLHWRGGDARSPGKDLYPGLGFGFDAALPPGTSQIFLRGETINSAALSLQMDSLADTAQVQSSASHWLGLVHGFLFALVIVYGLLWVALRDASLLRYLAYVASYLYMHLAYSGIAIRMAWPEATWFAQYAILIGMCLFSSAGLSFARHFLELPERAPRLNRVVAWTARVPLILLVVAMLISSRHVAVMVSFAFINVFTIAMVSLGIVGIRLKSPQAGFFLASTIACMLGTLVATLAVMGVLPFNAFTFRSIALGVMIEASLWGLALGLRLRRDRVDRAVAIEMARHDPLTAVLNRRGFLDEARMLRELAIRRGRPLTAFMLDIDHFKSINDQYGHDAGDAALIDVAKVLKSHTRSGDLVARWGGEEFAIILPDTWLQPAERIAETIREAVKHIQIDSGTDSDKRSLTISIGIAELGNPQSLEELLRVADAALYHAKQTGRDRVVHLQIDAGNQGSALAGGELGT